MRVTTVLCLLATATLAASCSSNEGLSHEEMDMAVAAVPDLAVRPPDLSVPPDLRQPPPPPRDLAYNPPTDANGISCGPMTCGPGQLCCLSVMGMTVIPSCAASCNGDGGQIPVVCDGPGNCGGNPCCVAINGGGGMFGGQVSCGMKPTDCSPEFNLANRSGTTRRCHVDGDCTAGAPNSQLTDCCTISQGGADVQLCLSQTIAGFIGGHCP